MKIDHLAEFIDHCLSAVLACRTAPIWWYQVWTYPFFAR